MTEGPGLTLRWPAEALPDDKLRALIGPGAPFELVEETVRGARVRVFAKRHRNLRQLMVSAAERFGDHPYVVFPDREYTYASFLGAVASAAKRLSEEHGVGKGDRVALASASTAEYVVALWAAFSLGAVVVALNGWWTGAELAHGIGLTTPRVVLGDRRRLERLAGREVGGAALGAFEDRVLDLDAPAADVQLPDTPIDEDEPCLVLFTSGTTGRSKGAVLSHRNNVHFGQSLLLGGAETVMRAMERGGEPPPTMVDPGCAISAMPLFHTSGLCGHLIGGMFTGVTTVFPQPGRWREDVHLELTQRYGATMWSLVPTQLWRLLEWPDLDRYDISTVKRIGGGASVWPPELLRKVEERMPGVQRTIGYGMTETSSCGTALRHEASFEHPDSVGQPGATVEVQIRNPATNKVLEEGAVGEICLRCAGTFLGYWGDPEATKAVLEPDGWYHTGDHGYIRDTFVYLGGRRTDLILRGGENIYPVEVENRLIEHPAILDVAVIGRPHPTLGEEVHAVVVRRPGSDLDAEGVRSWAAEALAAFKVPTTVEFAEALPRNAAGKVMKHLLARPEQPSRFVEE